MDIILKLEAKLAKIEEFFLSFLVLCMIIISVIQIFLRNFFNSSINDADVLVRALVLWIGFIGANLAVRRSKHINIDLFSKILSSEKAIKIRFIILNIFSSIFTIILAYLSFEYLILEFENAMSSFLGVPTYIIFVIVPISLIIMSFRFLILLILKKNIEKED